MTQIKHMQLFFVDPLNQSFLLAESDSLSPKDSPVTHARSPSCTRCSLSHPHRLLRDHAGHSGRGAGIFAPVEPTWGHQAASASPLLQGRQGLQRPSDLPPAAQRHKSKEGCKSWEVLGLHPPWPHLPCRALPALSCPNPCRWAMSPPPSPCRGVSRYLGHQLRLIRVGSQGDFFRMSRDSTSCICLPRTH